MPNKFVTLDTGFPTFSGSESTAEKIDAILSYQYQLQESLRYLLRHLDISNFDEEGLATITEPLKIALKEDFNSLNLNIDAEGIMAQIKGLESQLGLKVSSDLFQRTISTQDGKISQITQTVDGIETTVENQNGKISTLTQTVNGFKTTVSEQNGKITTLTQTVNGFQATVSDHTNQISQITQQIDSIGLSVVNGSGGKVFLQLNNGSDVDKVGITLGAVDGSGGGTILQMGIGNLTVRSEEINIGGAVTFWDLETGGASVINGDNITTGTIQGASFVAMGDGRTTESQFIVRETSMEEDIGGIRYDYVWGETSEDGYDDYGDKLYLYTVESRVGSRYYYPSIKLESVGRISIQADDYYHGYVYISAGGMPYDVNPESGIVLHTERSAIVLQTLGYIWRFEGDSLYRDGERMVW